MSETDEPEQSGAQISPSGDADIAGDVVGGDKIVYNYYNVPAVGSAASTTDLERRVRLTIHLAAFSRTGIVCWFINATNLSDRDVEITHVWLECDPKLYVMQPDRPLPKRLKPDETWETWIEASRLPGSCSDPYSLARARLSTGLVIESIKAEGVPDMGYVPGGPISGIGNSGSQAIGH